MNTLLTTKLTRRQLGQLALATGLAGPMGFGPHGVRAQASPTAVPETLNIAIYTWLRDFYRTPLDQLNAEFSALPVRIAKLMSLVEPKYEIAAAAAGHSDYDLMIGTTPFFEVQALVEGGAIEPWDPYLPAGLLDDLPPLIREEGSFDGKLYSWPVMYEPVCQGWNADIVERAGLDPTQAPNDWDEFIANATRVQQSGAAEFGCSFDPMAWRSLIPIAHTFAVDLFEPDGTFAWTSDAAVASLETMRRMTELANPDVMNYGTYPYGSQGAGYLVSWMADHLMLSSAWDDPGLVRVARMPMVEQGPGATLFWCTGAVLATHGGHKPEAAAYLDALTHDERFYRFAITGDPDGVTARTGQLPVLDSTWDQYETAPPDWLAGAPWVSGVWDWLDNARFIEPTRIGLYQFILDSPEITAYLKGDGTDARAALEAYQQRVRDQFAAA